MNADEIKKDIARLEAKIKALEDRYGSGIRPSWVSADLAIYRQALAGAKRMLSEI